MILDFEYKDTASLDVDPQCSFSPLCPDELPVPDGHNIVDALNEQATHARLRIVSMDVHPTDALWLASEEHPQLSPIEGYPELDVYWNSHCIIGTKGCSLLPELHIHDYHHVILKGMFRDKHPYGACYHDLSETISTGLIRYLKEENIKNVIVGGLAFEYCVSTTALQLVRAGFNVCVNLAATRSLGDPKEARENLVKSGVILI
jgi:nicotinamidase/pyrazinamidase